MKEKLALSLLLVISIFTLTGCGETKKEKPYSKKDYVGALNYVLKVQPEKIESSDDTKKYYYSDFYIEVRMSSEIKDLNDNYEDREENGIGYKYFENKDSESNLRYSSIFRFMEYYYYVDYYNTNDKTKENNKELYDEFISTVKFN